MNLQLKDLKIAIAGSSKGLGFSIARLLVDEGAKVWLTGRDEKALVSASQNLGQASYTTADLTTSDGREKFYSHVNQSWGLLDGLVLNIGGGKTKHQGVDTPDEEYKRIFDLNFFSHVALVRAFTPLLKKSKHASIVSVSSIAGEISMLAPLSYSAAKAALNQFSIAAANELSEMGIRYNTVTPGNIFYQGGRWDEIKSEDPKRFEKAIERVPMKRMGKPEEIAAMIAFLISPMASFSTGSIFRADGGQAVHFEKAGK